jgi:hypothetical protein
LIDVARLAQFRFEHDLSSLPIRLPPLAFSDHLLVVVATLSTHPTERMAGCLATLSGCMPTAGTSRTRAVDPELAALQLQVWPPDLCILDARQVRRWDEEHSLDLSSLGTILVGRDPLAVDVTGARLLGLEPTKVPLLAAVRRKLHRRWPNTGEVPSLLTPPAPSRYFWEARMRDGVRSATGVMNRSAERVLRTVDLPRLIDFVRRAQREP